MPIPSRILISGGRGRLSRVLRAHFASAGAVVTSLSRTPGDGHLGLADALAGSALDQADTFLHLAWSTVPLTSERNVGAEWNADLPLLLTLLNRIAQLPHPERLHFVFFSTAGAVYGNAPARPNVEGDTCHPLGWYAHAKLAAEQLVQEFARRYGLATTILRITNPYGFPGQAHKPQGLVPVLIAAARRGTPVSIWGDGSARKDFLYHSDFSRAVSEVAARRALGLFNVAAGESHTVNEVIQRVEAVTGRRITTQQGPAYPWDVQDNRVDHQRLCQAIDWRPQVSFDEGIARVAKELRDES